MLAAAIRAMQFVVQEIVSQIVFGTELDDVGRAAGFGTVFFISGGIGRLGRKKDAAKTRRQHSADQGCHAARGLSGSGTSPDVTALTTVTDRETIVLGYL